MLLLWENIRQDIEALVDKDASWAHPLRRAHPASLEDIELAIHTLHALRQVACREDCRRRRNTWAAWVHASWAHDRGKLYRHTRGDPTFSAAMLQRADGTYTAESAEMDAILREAWSPIFRLYAHHPEPAWDGFVARFGRYIARHEMCLTDLTADDLRLTLKRQHAKSACGMDGWRVSELKALPPFLLGKLADVRSMLLNERGRGLNPWNVR